MKAIHILWAVGMVGLNVLVPAFAQTPVHAHPAELAVPFGVVEGQLIVVSDQLVFVEADAPEAAFAVARSNVTRIEHDGGILTIHLRSAVRNGQNPLRLRLAQADQVVSWYGMRATRPSGPALGDESDVLASFQVKHDHLIGSCVGRLIVTDERLAFESVSELNDSRQWAYADVQEIEQDGIYRLKVRPFLGNEYNLELVGQGLDSELYRALVERVADARAR